MHYAIIIILPSGSVIMSVHTSLSLLTNMQGIKPVCVHLHKHFHLNTVLILMSNMKQWIQVLWLYWYLYLFN